jgi:hypothetical protein
LLEWLALRRAGEDRSGCSKWILLLFFIDLPPLFLAIQAAAAGFFGAAALLLALFLALAWFTWWQLKS